METRAGSAAAGGYACHSAERRNSGGLHRRCTPLLAAGTCRAATAPAVLAAGHPRGGQSAFFTGSAAGHQRHPHPAVLAGKQKYPLSCAGNDTRPAGGTARRGLALLATGSDIVSMLSIPPQPVRANIARAR